MVFPNPNAELTLARIGTAAVNIGGNTIHSKFGFSVIPKIGLFETPSALKTRQLREAFHGVRFLLVDEAGMNSNVMFAEMDMILRMCFDTRKPFGGIFVICFGDLLQMENV
ncbi:unnamed protein product [Caenorhabditis nigoni]